MAKRFPVYPFLFVLYIVLTPLVLNLEQIDPLQAARPLVVLLSILLLGIFVFYAFFKDWQYAGYAVLLCLLFFFVYGHLNRLVKASFPADQELNPYLLMLFWGSHMLIVGLRLFWRSLGCATWIPVLLTVILGLAVLIQGFTGAGEYYRTRQSFARTPGSAESPLPADPIARKIKEMTGSTSKIVAVPPDPTIIPVKRASFMMAKTVLGWEATTSLNDGLDATISCYNRMHGENS